MSLTSALNTAQSILSNTSTQTSLLSKNLSNVDNPNYARRIGEVATSSWGAQIVDISRAGSEPLLRSEIESRASASGQNALLDGLEQIRAMLGGNDYEAAPSTLIGQFRDTLELFASRPGDTSAAQAAVSDATTLADGIRTMSIDVQKYRLETDAEIARQVEDLNKYLGEFEVANNDVKQATQTGRDTSDALDERERLLRSISEIVGVKVVTRTNNDVALYTTAGDTLFESIPREVTFERTGGFDASVIGNPILIGGVEMDAGSGGASTASGSLQGLLQMRDQVAPTFQSQLDEVARVLVTTFAETDPNGVEPNAPGLFIWDTDAIPADGVIEPGLAMSLRVDDAYSPTTGDPFLLRDGGKNGADYVVNPTGATGYSALLDGYVSAIDEAKNYDVNALAGESETLISFASNSVGWLEALRQQADRSAETKNAAFYRTTEALSNATGVNVDEEMAKLLELEQSYKASSRLIAAVDEMINTLLGSVR